jgi:CBS domain containing-hemolysin-like protein
MYTLLIIFFLVSIIFSFLCSIWEAVLLSITPSFAAIKRQEGGEVGRTLDEFKANIDRPLAAILTLNTIAHTVGAIGVGAQATSIWGASIISTAVVPVVVTLAILILSEIIPKTIGANYWRELASFTVVSLKFILKVLAPLVFISQLITKALKKDKQASVFSRADFTAMAELGSQEGVFDEGESELLKSFLRFDSILAKDVMTPRTVVVAADEKTPILDFHRAHPNLRFSRIPVYADSLDVVTGYVLKDQMLNRLVDQLAASGGQTTSQSQMQSLRRDIIVVHEQEPIPQLFNDLREKREHIALVVDEFGGMAGIVTLEDVLETLLGMEIVDESDKTVDMQALARKQWEQRAERMGLSVISQNKDTE